MRLKVWEVSLNYSSYFLPLSHLLYISGCWKAQSIYHVSNCYWMFLLVSLIGTSDTEYLKSSSYIYQIQSFFSILYFQKNKNESILLITELVSHLESCFLFSIPYLIRHPSISSVYYLFSIPIDNFS